jgi:hypothetical protein
LSSDIPSIADTRPTGKAFWFILALAALLRGFAAARRPLQVDEAYSLHLARLPLHQALDILARLDVHPPGFLVLTHAMAAVHAPPGAFRFLVAACGVVSIVLLSMIVAAWHGRRAALVAAFVAAVLPVFIFYDTMVRMYAPFDTLALASYAVLGVLYTREGLPVWQRRALWAAWALLAALLVWWLYLGFFVLAAQAAYAAVVRREGLARTLAGMGFALLAWLPQAPVFLRQLPRGGLAFPGYAGHELQAFLLLPGQATIAVQTQGAGVAALGAAIVAWLWVGAALAWGLRGDTWRSLAVWVGAPGLLTLLFGIASHKLLYADRYYLAAAYGLCVMTGIAVDRLAAGVGPSHLRRPLQVAAVCAAAMLVAAGLAYAVVPSLYTADWPSVAAILERQAQPGDLIVFEQGSPYWVLHGGAALRGHPLLLLFYRGQAGDALRLARPFRRVWLVLFQWGPVDPDARLLHGLAAADHAVAAWRLRRWLPAETVTLILFARGRS